MGEGSVRRQYLNEDGAGIASILNQKMIACSTTLYKKNDTVKLFSSTVRIMTQ